MINETMRLNVKMINSFTFPVDIHRKGSIGLLKQKISEKISMVPSKQRLIFQGKVLLNDKLLIDYRLEENDVVHLIEQTLQQPSQMQESANSRSDDTFNDLLSSLFNRNPLFHSSVNANNVDSNSDIPCSFHHLLKKSNFIQAEAIETITQGTNSLFDMMHRAKSILLSNAGSVKHLYSSADRRELKVGQWVDIKDSSDQWIEGQIAEIKGDEVNVHYLGLTNQINHWIDLYSSRIALFRSFTSQTLTNEFASPFPSKTATSSTHPSTISIDPHKKYHPLTNDLITLLDFIKEKSIKLIKMREAMKEGSYRNKEDFLNNERFFYLQQMQLYPLMDRVGRLPTDISCYLMNVSFNFFEDNIYLFRANIQDERLSFLNYNERNADLIRKSEIKEFIQLTDYSVLKMKKEEVEQRRPVLGLLVNVQRTERRPTEFSSERISVRREEAFSFNSLQAKVVDKGIQVRANAGFDCLRIVLNEEFSFDKIKLDSNKSFIKQVNGNGNASKRAKGKIKTEKVVLVSKDKPLSDQSLQIKNAPNDNSAAPKKRYMLSQSKKKTSHK